MKQGKFITSIANAYQVPLGTVRQYALNLRKAGLLTSGPHGVNAPDMTSRDAARMTIAIVGTEKPTKAVEALMAFGGLTVSRSFSQGDAPSFAFDADYAISFEEALEEYFEAKTVIFVKMRAIEINRTEPTARIEFASGSAIFDGIFPSNDQEKHTNFTGGVELIARLNSFRLSSLAQSLNGPQASEAHSAT